MMIIKQSWFCISLMVMLFILLMIISDFYGKKEKV
jgi:hypothetical protein